MRKEVRLYIETSIRGPRRRTGAYAYVLEYRSAAGPVTLTESKSTAGHHGASEPVRGHPGSRKKA